MTRMGSFARLCLLGMVLLAAYQVAVGIDGLSAVPIAAYTVAFGVLLVAGLLMIILGFEALEAPIVVILSTVIPLSLAVGLIWQHAPTYRLPFLVFAALGLAAVAWTRAMPASGAVPALTVAVVHGISGLIIFLLPIALSLRAEMAPAFSLVGLGGALIGVVGLMLAFLRLGRPILPRHVLLRLMPLLLLVTTLLFVAGFRFGAS